MRVYTEWTLETYIYAFYDSRIVPDYNSIKYLAYRDDPDGAEYIYIVFQGSDGNLYVTEGHAYDSDSFAQMNLLNSAKPFDFNLELQEADYHEALKGNVIRYAAWLSTIGDITQILNH